jgi:hypothetical protein
MNEIVRRVYTWSYDLSNLFLSPEVEAYLYKSNKKITGWQDGQDRGKN